MSHRVGRNRGRESLSVGLRRLSLRLGLRLSLRVSLRLSLGVSLSVSSFRRRSRGGAQSGGGERDGVGQSHRDSGSVSSRCDLGRGDCGIALVSYT